MPNLPTQVVDMLRSPKQTTVNGMQFNRYQVIKTQVQPSANHPFIGLTVAEIHATCLSLFDNFLDGVEPMTISIQVVQRCGGARHKWKVFNGETINATCKIIIHMVFEPWLHIVGSAFKLLQYHKSQMKWNVYPPVHTKDVIFCKCDVVNIALHIITELDPVYAANLYGLQRLQLLIHLDAVGHPHISFISFRGFNIEGEPIFTNQRITSKCYPVAAAACNDVKAMEYITQIYEDIAEQFNGM